MKTGKLTLINSILFKLSTINIEFENFPTVESTIEDLGDGSFRLTGENKFNTFHFTPIDNNLTEINELDIILLSVGNENMIFFEPKLDLINNNIVCKFFTLID